jgi:adenylate cyclase
MFRRAIALDPGYALAYAGLADASGVRHGSFGGGEEALAQADAASKRALELDPMLAEAHAARGLALSYHAQFDEADRELREAIRLDPTSYDNAYHYGRVLVSAGRLEEAARMFETAASLRAEDYQALALANNMYHRLGREAEHRDAGLRAIDAANHALAINPADTRALTLGASTLMGIGEEERGREWLERALKLDATNPITFYNASCFESLVGRTDVALDYLQQAVHLGLHNIHWLLNDPDIASLRDHPRFAAILREVEAATAG